MKFISNVVCGSARHGCVQIQDVLTEEIFALQTPGCMLYTRAGSVPYLTRDALDRIQDLPPVVHMPLPYWSSYLSSVQAYGQGVKTYTAMKGFAVYLSIQDPGLKFMSGYNTKSAVSMFSKAGRVIVDQNTFQDIVTSFKPEIVQVLNDCDVFNTSSTKRILKARERNKAFWDESVEKCSGGKDKEEKVALLGTVPYCPSEEEVVKFAQSTAARNPEGYVLEGFNSTEIQVGNEVHRTCFNQCQTALRKVMDVLPRDKLKIMHGSADPTVVLEAVDMGVDVFDSVYPYQCTESKVALVFDYRQQSTADRHPLTLDIAGSDCEGSLEPLLDWCKCYTCREHSKAYVCHLLKTSEILGSVLLMIHNLHHYLRYFEEIRQILTTNNTEDWQNYKSSIKSIQ